MDIIAIRPETSTYFRSVRPTEHLDTVGVAIHFVCCVNVFSLSYELLGERSYSYHFLSQSAKGRHKMFS